MKVLHLTMIVPFLLGGVIGEYTVRSGGAGDDEFCRGSPFLNQQQPLADCLGAHLRRSPWNTVSGFGASYLVDGEPGRKEDRAQYAPPTSAGASCPWTWAGLACSSER